MSKLPKATLSLKQVSLASKTEFLLRQEVLKLYRDILRTVKRVPDEKTRLELKEWARGDFKSNKSQNDENAIKALLHYGRKSLQDLEKSIVLSK